jgi:hypothetical protein
MKNGNVFINVITVFAVLLIFAPAIFFIVFDPGGGAFHPVLILTPIGFLVLTFFNYRHRRAELTTEISSAVSAFGNIVPPAGEKDSAPTVRFERNGSVFAVQVFETKYNVTYTAVFRIQREDEKFLIQDDAYFSSKGNFSDCRPVDFPGLTRNPLLYSSYPQFLLYLLNKESIRREIEKYPVATFWTQSHLSISFENSLFVLEWKADSRDQQEKLRMVCETAVVFQEEIKNYAEIR